MRAASPTAWKSATKGRLWAGFTGSRSGARSSPKANSRYTLLDAQFPNPHLEQFGAVTVTEERFQNLLTQALARSANFYGLGRAGAAAVGAVAGAGRAAGEAGGAGMPGGSGGGAAAGSGSSVLQVITQTS